MPARLELTCGAATVVVSARAQSISYAETIGIDAAGASVAALDAIITGLVCIANNVIAANCKADAWLACAEVPAFDFATRTTAITTCGVVVVAGLGGFDNSIATQRTYARRTCANPAGFFCTGVAATVTAREIVIVTSFIHVDDAVSADCRNADGQLAQTSISRFGLAAVVAAVVGREGSRVAGFTAGNTPVTADSDTCLANDRTCKPNFNRARR